MLPYSLVYGNTNIHDISIDTHNGMHDNSKSGADTLAYAVNTQI